MTVTTTRRVWLRVKEPGGCRRAAIERGTPALCLHTTPKAGLDTVSTSNPNPRRLKSWPGGAPPGKALRNELTPLQPTNHTEKGNNPTTTTTDKKTTRTPHHLTQTSGKDAQQMSYTTLQVGLEVPMQGSRSRFKEVPVCSQSCCAGTGLLQV